MNTSALRRVLPASAPGRLVVLVLLAAALMGLAAAVVLEPIPPVAVIAAGQTAAPPTTELGPVSAPAPFIDHSAIDWDRVPMSPDPSPLSVAAYGS